MQQMMQTLWNDGRGYVGLSALVALGALAVTATPVLAAGPAEPREGVTYTKDIAPILQRSCQTCHRPGGIGPMALISYEGVRPWARAIKLKTSLSSSDPERMPPWFVEKNVGIQQFTNDPSLSDEEIATIATWSDSGAPRGNPADLPPSLPFRDSAKWRIGTPDLIVSSPVRTVPAVAADYQGDFGPATPIGLLEDRYVKAVEVREIRVVAEKSVDGPADQSRAALNAGKGGGNYTILHHAVITARTELGGNNDGPTGREPGSFSIAHEAGQNATYYPDDVGRRLPAGSYLTWSIHTHAIGKEVQIRLDVGFKLHPKGYTPKYSLGGTSGSGSLTNHDLDIPAGEDNVRFDALRALSEPAKLITFEPHMHASGSRMCLEVTYPSGARQTLNCAGYNHNWVKVYSYTNDAAPLLPAGTILHVIGWYDNSRKNPRNVDARNWKGFGNRSIDDMMFFFGKFVGLTDEQFKEEVAARYANGKVPHYLGPKPEPPDKTTTQN